MGVQSINLESERIGMINRNKYGSTMEIVKYNRSKDIWVKFEKGKPIHTSWQLFCKGDVKSPYDKTVYGTGFIGEGEYKVIKNGKKTSQYSTWQSMLERCYSKKLHEKFPTYIGCTVSEEWHNFQVFAKWYDNNYYGVDGQRIELDKDILIKGNKIYSSETCIFVPHFINTLFIKCDSVRGDLPIGVSYHKRRKKYIARFNNGTGKEKSLGGYDTPDESFQVYKLHKEKYIKVLAEDYKDKIPVKLYEAMMNYEVEITD